MHDGISREVRLLALDPGVFQFEVTATGITTAMSVEAEKIADAIEQRDVLVEIDGCSFHLSPLGDSIAFCLHAHEDVQFVLATNHFQALAKAVGFQSR